MIDARNSVVGVKACNDVRLSKLETHETPGDQGLGSWNDQTFCHYEGA